MLRTLRTALFLLAAALPLQAQSDAAVSKGIHDREVQWRTAISLGNWSAVESFLAPDFVMTTADGGRLDRAKYLKELQRRGISVLLVEQKLAIALQISDRCLVMGHGSIVFEGTPAELRANADVRKEWLEV